MKTLIYILLCATILSSVIAIIIPKSENAEVSFEKKVNNENNLILIIKENSLLLISEETIIKTYDINPSVLPGEDIYLLTKGITVSSISEADEVAENFDG